MKVYLGILYLLLHKMRNDSRENRNIGRILLTNQGSVSKKLLPNYTTPRQMPRVDKNLGFLTECSYAISPTYYNTCLYQHQKDCWYILIGMNDLYNRRVL